MFKLEWQNMSNMPKTGHKIILSTLILLVLIVILGFVYVYYSDQAPSQTVTHKTAQAYAPLPPPTQPGANAPEGVVVESLDTPVTPGSNTSMIINTNAGSICTIVVTYNGITSKDSGLVPKKADSYGNVTWSWSIPSSTPVGNWPIKVTCTFHGRTGVDISNLQVNPI